MTVHATCAAVDRVVSADVSGSPDAALRADGGFEAGASV